ncbi:hypothetical protein [Leptospira bouyouniensis]|nr:hypothetical protein [Leptospira bouyouniensis]
MRFRGAGKELFESIMKNYQHVTEEAPYSAWDLCFLQNQFIAE